MHSGATLGSLNSLVFDILDQLFDAANGIGSLRGSEHDAFSYAVVDLIEDGANSRLKVTVRGNTEYMDGADYEAVRIEQAREYRELVRAISGQ